MDTNVLTVHVSESGTTINKFQRTAIITGLVVPFNHRKETKQAIKQALITGGVDPEKRLIKWTKVSPKEQHVYMNVLTAMNNEEQVKCYSIKINNFDYKKLYPAYIQLVTAIQADFPDAKLRVFIPENKTSKVDKLAGLNKAFARRKLDVEAFQSPIEESRFIQVADLIAGAILFYLRDDMYFEKMGTPGKASVVEHGLSLKKQRDKFKVIPFKERR